MPAVIQVLATGVGLSIQDRGRPGWRRFGVPPGGVMDRYAANWANDLLGNSRRAPVLEIALQGAVLKILKDTWIALAGADLGAAVRPWTAVRVKAGEELSFTQPRAGVWAYLALPGGVVAPSYFGSAAVDARNGLGSSLRVGSIVRAECHEPNLNHGALARRSVCAESQREYANCPVLGLLKGPQYSAFDQRSRAQMVSATWTVSTAMDRTGFRLEGPPLAVPDSIASEPVLPGSLQVPGNGQPIVTLHDGPTVGGYPKIGVLRDSDLDWLCQCKPDTQLRFQWVD
jgi:biotin-dependent carboxylase-like uncharacterized protein